jgi:hypothetical protein
LKFLRKRAVYGLKSIALDAENLAGGYPDQARDGRGGAADRSRRVDGGWSSRH